MQKALQGIDEKLATLQLLADELMKSSPRENMIKQYMQKSGLKYDQDPIERIDVVLRALQFTSEQR